MKKTEKGTSPFWDYIGMEEVVLQDGTAELKIDVTENLLNRADSVQGGVLATLIDGATGSAISSVLPESQTITTIELKINYLLSAKGEYLIAKAKMKHKGKTIAVAEAEIYDQNEKMVAMGTASFMILNLK